MWWMDWRTCDEGIKGRRLVHVYHSRSADLTIKKSEQMSWSSALQ